MSNDAASVGEVLGNSVEGVLSVSKSREMVCYAFGKECAYVVFVVEGVEANFPKDGRALFGIGGN